jgi:hypothetical protein
MAAELAASTQSVPAPPKVDQEFVALSFGFLPPFIPVLEPPEPS